MVTHQNKIVIISDDPFIEEALNSFVQTDGEVRDQCNSITSFKLPSNTRFYTISGEQSKYISSDAKILVIDMDAIKENLQIQNRGLPEVVISSNECSGVDLVKPFHIHSLLDIIIYKLKFKKYSVGEFIFDANSRTVTWKDQSVNITESEGAILEKLLTNNGWTKQDLLANVLGYSYGADTLALEMHIYRLRQKLSQIGCAHFLETIGSASQYKFTVR